MTSTLVHCFLAILLQKNCIAVFHSLIGTCITMVEPLTIADQAVFIVQSSSLV